MYGRVEVLDEFGSLPKIDSAEVMFSAGRSRRISIVVIIQSMAQLEQNYGREGASIIADNCQLTIFGGFAPNSDMPKFLGIEFIKAYVEAAYRENQFCSYFTAEDIHHLLYGYAEDYGGLLINIYEQILTAALGCVIAGVDCSRLDITEAGAQYLYQTFEGQSKTEILAAITKAAGELNRRYQFSPELTRYVQNSLPLIASSIEVAAREHRLNHVFFMPAFPENNPKIIFSYGEKMNDERYRKVIAEITACRFLRDKIAVIKEHIHSLADLDDVLLDAELTGEEIESVLRELSFSEIAAPNKRHQPISDVDTTELREQEQLLRTALQRYIFSLPQMQQDLIHQASKAMQEE